MKLSDYVVGFVADLGVKHVFVVTGGGAMHLNDSLARCERLEFICNHHEQACAIAADNYSKATDRIGVAMVTTGPGGTNTITGLAAAFLDSTPCLFLSGQVKRADRMFAEDGTPLGVRQKGPQEIDIISLVKPLTKYAVTVTDPASIRYHMEKAVHLAFSGRPGPVWIDLPLDIQASNIDETSLAPYQPEEAPEDKSQLREQVRSIIEKINHSKRPFLLLGNGVRLAHAAQEFRELGGAAGSSRGRNLGGEGSLRRRERAMHGEPGNTGPPWRKFCHAELGFSAHDRRQDGCCGGGMERARNLRAALTR